jgi:DNA processing protein
MTQIVDLRDLPGTPRGISENAQREELWCDGNLELLTMPLASIVGTRDVSPEGVRRTRKLAAVLVSEGFCIVSGLAKGVDRVAHETALSMNGHTIAVMGTAIDECYPIEHQELKDRITRRGLVLSQFAPGTPVRRSNFPQRNVLMATLSSTTFVVEASVDSGTKHQVRAAVRMGKKVAFLASLVNQDYPWVQEALDAQFGVIIEHTEDAVALLREVKHRLPNHISPGASTSLKQTEFGMDLQRASENGALVSENKVARSPVEVKRDDFDAAEHFEAHTPLLLVPPTPKPNFFERIWHFIFGAVAKH